MGEIWKPIDGYEGYYEVSNLGSVRGLERYVPHNNYLQHCPPKVLRQKNTWDGYKEVTLQKNHIPKCYRVHRLVARMFLGEPPSDNHYEINHIDGNKQNNCIDNLEWVTSSENQKHAYRLGLQKVSGHAISGRKPIVCLTLNHYEPSYNAMMRYLNKEGYCQSTRLNWLSQLANKSSKFTYHGLQFSTEERDIENVK